MTTKDASVLAQPAVGHSNRCAVNTRAGSSLGCSQYKLAHCLQEEEEPANVATDLYFTCKLISSLIGLTAHLYPPCYFTCFNLRRRHQLNEAYTVQSVFEHGSSECTHSLFVPNCCDATCWPMFRMFNITRKKIGAHLVVGAQHCLLADERERKSIARAVRASKITCFEELSFSSCMEQSERICVTAQDTATPTKSHLFKTPAD